MPTYEYACPKCGKHFEAYRPIEIRRKVHCKCGMKATLKISAPRLNIFKPRWDYNMGPERVRVESVEQYKQELKKHGLTMG